MKKLIKYKILFISILVINFLFIYKLDNVDADSPGYSISPASGGGVAPSCASGNNCLTRGTAGVRFALVNKSGNVMKGKNYIKDYWFYDSHRLDEKDPYGRTCIQTGTCCSDRNNCGYDYLYFGSANNYYAFDQKYLKQDLMNYIGDKPFYSNTGNVWAWNSVVNANNSSGTQFAQDHVVHVVPSSNNHSGIGSFKTLDSIEAIYENSNPESGGGIKAIINWWQGYDNLNKTPHVRRAKSVDYIVQIIKNQYKNTGSSLMLDNILKDLGYTEADLKKYKKDGYYLQMEPLVTWGNVTNGNTNIFYGTPSELSLFMFTYGTGGKASRFDHYNYIITFFGDYHEYGIFASDKSNMPSSFEPVNNSYAYYSDFAATASSNKKYAYGVGYISLKDYGTDSCSSLVSDAYDKYLKGKSNVSTTDADNYDAAVLEACDEDGVGICEWLTWNKYSGGKSNVGGNFKNYGLESKIKNGDLESCEKPACNDVATSKFGTNLKIEDSWKTKPNGPKDFEDLFVLMINDLLSNNPSGQIKSNYWWGSTSFQNVFKFMTTSYNSSELKFGSKSDGTFNNMILTKLFGSGVASSNNYCGVSTCDSVLSKLKPRLSEKIYGKTVLEWLSLVFPKYDMLYPEMLMNDDTGVIDYNLAACKGIPSCNTKAVAASCKKKENLFTFTDLVSDEAYNSGAEFSMDASVFASLTSGTFATNNSCLNAGYAYTSINNTKLEKKNFQKSKSSEKFESDSICWESVTFDLPESVGEKNPIQAGTLFRWGKGGINDTQSKIYGTMTIDRYCTIKPVTNTSIDTLVVGSEWANVIDGKPLIGATTNTDGLSTGVPSSVYNSSAKINPEIKLHYQEAVPKSVQSKYLEKEYKMDVELASVSTDVYARTSTNGATLTSSLDHDMIDYEKSVCGNPTNTLSQCIAANSYVDHPRRASLTRSGNSNIFNNGGVVATIAKYNIVYNDNLNWYSDKSSNFKKSTATEIKNAGDSVDDAKYVSLGYGLPTSFVTPPLPAGNFYYGYSIDSSEKRGKMYVTIKNIGTKGSTGNYHFDGLLKTSKNVLYDDDNGTHNDELVYSCGFNISNAIYCYECNPDIYKKDCPSGICEVQNNVPNGIDVIFRTVELVSDPTEIEQAFPGRSGTGRVVGANWNFSNYDSEVEKVTSQHEISKKIVSQLLNQNIYESAPKYVIDLNSVNIQNIRKENDKDSYTSLKNYEFSKNSSTHFTTNDWQKAIKECNDSNKNGCRRMSYLMRTVSEVSSTNYKKLDYAYTYAASDFLSKLIKDKKLTGACANESDTKNRAKTYAESYGC